MPAPSGPVLAPRPSPPAMLRAAKKNERGSGESRELENVRALIDDLADALAHLCVHFNLYVIRKLERSGLGRLTKDKVLSSKTYISVFKNQEDGSLGVDGAQDPIGTTRACILIFRHR